MSYSRDYEQGLLNTLLAAGFSYQAICEHLLNWLDSDNTCEALEDMCRDNDVQYEEDL